MATKDDSLPEYRKVLVAADAKAQDDIDKLIVSLSGGGLGVSLVFLKDVIGLAYVQWPWALLGSWITWGASTACVLLSYYTSHATIGHDIKLIDSGKAYGSDWGGAYGRWTRLLNAAGGILFVAGVICILMFTGKNFYEKGVVYGQSQSAAAAAASAPARTTKP